MNTIGRQDTSQLTKTVNRNYTATQALEYLEQSLKSIYDQHKKLNDQEKEVMINYTNFMDAIDKA